MSWVVLVKIVSVILFGLLLLAVKPMRRAGRVSAGTRGRQLGKEKKQSLYRSCEPVGGIRWGNAYLDADKLIQHFLVAGVTGSGKTHVQRMALLDALRNMQPNSDRRLLIYDAKGDTTSFLKQVGVSVPIFSLNPFESRQDPKAVAWDIAKDITSPTRALNFAFSLVRGEDSGNNQYFTNAARYVIYGIVLSFMKHSGTDWTFSDVVQATGSRDAMVQVLARDAEGKKIVEELLTEDRTGQGVVTSVTTDMLYYQPIAALWQRCEAKLSLREWLNSDSILLLGANRAAKASLDVINQQMFNYLADEIDLQTNSSTRRTGVWIDEASEAECLLKSGALVHIARKGRSRGWWVMLGLQDIADFRKACGSTEMADTILGQLSNKCLLRMESFETAEWATKLVGAHETIVIQHSDSSGRQLLSGESRSEQHTLKENVLPSEFYAIDQTSPETGLTGYYISPSFGAYRATTHPSVVEQVVVSDAMEEGHAICYRAEADEWLKRWTLGDKQRLGLAFDRTKELKTDAGLEHVKQSRIKQSVNKRLDELMAPQNAGSF